MPTIRYVALSDGKTGVGPGLAWARFFAERWPYYRQWYVSHGRGGHDAKPSLATCQRMLRTHMPEMVDLWQRFIDLADGDETAARLLSGYNPPPYISACSQGVMARPDPLLVRNYDYTSERFEAVIMKSWWGRRRVIGMSDCLLGLLDGVNDAGLAVSLTFGGREVHGEGFGIPFVLRYVLQTCTSVSDGVRTLRRVPVNQAHNVTLTDRHGAVATVLLSPDGSPSATPRPVATNHQGPVEPDDRTRWNRTVEREARMLELLARRDLNERTWLEAFLSPGLYSRAWDVGWGTLYTAAYRPAEGRAEYHWPGEQPWIQTFRDFYPGEKVVRLG